MVGLYFKGFKTKSKLYYSAIIQPFAATWTDLETIILSRVSQTEKDKYMISFICGVLKKNDTNELIYKTEIDPQT